MFSITLAASATRIDGALWVPAVMIDAYSASTKSATSGVEPDVILTIPVSGRAWSPGLIRSGL
jgi:hypothetical protein